MTDELNKIRDACEGDNSLHIFKLEQAHDALAQRVRELECVIAEAQPLADKAISRGIELQQATAEVERLTKERDRLRGALEQVEVRSRADIALPHDTAVIHSIAQQALDAAREQE